MFWKIVVLGSEVGWSENPFKKMRVCVQSCALDDPFLRPKNILSHFEPLVIEQQNIFQFLNLQFPDVNGCTWRCHGTFGTSGFTVNTAT
jgi:hypothetical protein